MFLRFLAFSGFAALVNLATGFFLYGYLGFNGTLTYPASIATAFMAGMGVSFTLNRAYTYDPSGRPVREELGDFFLVSIGGLLLTTTLAGLILKALRGTSTLEALPLAHETLAHIVAVGLTAFYSFFAHKYVSFRRAKAHIPVTASQARN